MKHFVSGEKQKPEFAIVSLAGAFCLKYLHGSGSFRWGVQMCTWNRTKGTESQDKNAVF